MFGLCFVMQYLMFFLVLQSSRLRRESWLLYFRILVLLACVNMSCVSSPRGTMVGLQYVISWSF